MDEDGLSHNKKLDSLLFKVLIQLTKGDDKFAVLQILKARDFASLSENEKVKVLTEMEPVNTNELLMRKCIMPSDKMVQSNRNGLLNFILQGDNVHTLKVVLQLLPLYSVYRHETDDQSKDTKENIAKPLYDAKARWDGPGSESQRTELAKTFQIITTVSENIATIVEFSGLLKFQLEAVARETTMISNLTTEMQNFMKSALQYVTKIKTNMKAIRKNTRTVKSFLLTLANNCAHPSVKAACGRAERVYQYVKRAEVHIDNVPLDIRTFCDHLGDMENDYLQFYRKLALREIQRIELVRQTAKTLQEDIQGTKEKIEVVSQNAELPQLTRERCVLRNTAFTLLAAQLFAVCCIYDAKRCMKFLLKQAPELVHVEVAGQLVMGSTLTSSRFNRDIAEMLLKQRAHVGHLDTCRELEKLYTNICFNRDTDKDEHSMYRDWWFQTRLMLDGNEDQTKNYRDQTGNTLLHILAVKLPDLQNPTKGFLS